MANNVGGIVPALTKALREKGYPESKIHEVIHTKRQDCEWATPAELAAADIDQIDRIATSLMAEYNGRAPEIFGCRLA